MESLTDRAFSQLSATCLSIVASQGFRGLSLRSVSKGSGWTMGEINYRFGAKKELVGRLIESERAAARAANENWLRRLARLRVFDAQIIASVIAEILDDAAINRRLSCIFWEELLVEAGGDATLRPFIEPYLAEQTAFWAQLLAGRHPKDQLIARVINNYVRSEQVYTLALQLDPTYRLMRAACIARLCSGLNGPAPDNWDLLLPPAVDTKTLTLWASKQAAVVARAAGGLILAQGVSMLTHRSVATELGFSGSAVSHHFRTRAELVSAGLQSMYEDIEDELSFQSIPRRNGERVFLPTALGDSSGLAVGLARAKHIVALASVREAALTSMVARERSSRGRLITSWFGDALIGTDRRSRIDLQLIALVCGGLVLQLLARGNAAAGAQTTGLAELLSV